MQRRCLSKNSQGKNQMGEEKQKIPVVFAVNDEYVKYLAVCITSILSNSQTGFYDFRVLHRNISKENQTKLKQLSGKKGTISFINVEGLLDSGKLYVSGHVTEETYYRILIPSMLPEYDKVIYLDCDLIVQGDLSVLFYKVDFTDNQWIAGTLAANLEGKNDYTTEHLGIPSNTFINPGVLIMNNRALRNQPFLQNCMFFLDEKKWLEQHDMDLLNAVCYGHICVLDRKWHATIGTIACSLGKRTDELTIEEISNYFIVHYATNKPWKTEITESSLLFWQYVAGSGFSHEIAAAYQPVTNSRQNIEGMCRRNEVSFSYIFHLFGISIKARLHL